MAQRGGASDAALVRRHGGARAVRSVRKDVVSAAAAIASAIEPRRKIKQARAGTTATDRASRDTA